MLDQITALFDSLFRFSPRLDIVSEKEAGIAWVRGRAQDIKHGCLYMYWPIWTEVEYIPLYPDPIDLPTQALMVGGKEVAASAVIEWRVINARAALIRRDVVDKLRCQGMAAVRNALFNATLAGLRKDEGQVEEDMRKDLQQSMRGYGVRIEQIYFSDLSTCNALLHIGSIIGGTEGTPQ